MTELEAIEQRHSVRRFEDRPIDPEIVSRLREEILAINAESGLRFQLFTEEPEAFAGNKTHYGKFAGCRNYFALVGGKDRSADIGYYGERLVLFAQRCGLNTCWAAMTYKKGKVAADAGKGEKLHIVIALGYGQTPGTPHKSRSAADVSDLTEASPEWYRNGIRAALLAPTAVNQQKFRFERNGDRVRLKTGFGFYTEIDKGIVKYHFEAGAGKDRFVWES